MRRASLVVAIVGAFVVGAVMVAIADRPRVIEPSRIHVVERPITDVVVDTGKAGDSSGDLLTFHNPLFDAENQVKVGKDQGDCVRISPAHGTWECRWIAWLDGGSITVEGPFFDTKPSVLAITGGTGIYSNARGTMLLEFGEDGTFDFIYRVRP